MNNLRQLPLRKDRKTRFIYCDESGLNERYFLLGALYHDLPHDTVERQIYEVKLQHGLRTEIKWEKLPSREGQFFDGYKAVLDDYLQSELFYKVFIVDTKKHPLKHPTFTNNSHQIGYFQYYSVLLYSGVISKRPNVNHRIYIDQPPYPGSKYLVWLEERINRNAKSNGFPDMHQTSCCRIQPANSKDLHSLQLVDLLTGVISCAWNKMVSNTTKLKFVDEFQSKTGVELGKPSLDSDGDRKCNRWLFQPRIPTEKAPLHLPTV